MMKKDLEPNKKGITVGISPIIIPVLTALQLVKSNSLFL
jgi:hypothetical protein